MGEESNERYTPESVLDVVRAVAPIGLDPCTTHDNRTRARIFYTETDDGLGQPWDRCRQDELIFCNPPYARGELMRWASKAVSEQPCTHWFETVLLTPCDLGTQWATLLFKHADALAGWHGRIAFVKPDGSYDTGAKQPSLFWYFGERAQRFRRVFGAHANVTILGGR